MCLGVPGRVVDVADEEGVLMGSVAREVGEYD